MQSINFDEKQDIGKRRPEDSKNESKGYGICGFPHQEGRKR